MRLGGCEAGRLKDYKAGKPGSWKAERTEKRLPGFIASQLPSILASKHYRLESYKASKIIYRL
jgi:hypothetical protein